MDLSGLLLTLALGLTTAYIASVAYCAWVLTHPPRRNYAWAVARNLPGDPSEVRSHATDAAGGLAYESWAFRSGPRELPVWDIAGLDPAGPVIIFTHGWGDSRVVALSRLAAFARFASRVVAWDLPGHGECPRWGAAGLCRLGSHEAADLVRLVERVDAPPDRLVLAGSSLGAGVCIEAVGRGLVRPRGVIAEAPYRVPIVPARNVMRNAGLPWRLNLPVAQALLGLWFARDPRWPWGGGRLPFDRRDWAAHLADRGVPLLVIHGDRDAVCPLDDGRDIAVAGRARLEIIEGGEHTNLWTQDTTRTLCAAAVASWLASLPAVSRQPVDQPTPAGAHPQ